MRACRIARPRQPIHAWMPHVLLAFVLMSLLPTTTAAAQPRLVGDDEAVGRVLDLVAERLSLMPQAAAAKWVSGAPIADPPREQAVLDREAAAAEQMSMAPLPVREFFAQQMHLARDLQLQLHGDWRKSGCGPCAPPPDLAVFRGEIDRINDGLLRSMYVALPVFALVRRMLLRHMPDDPRRRRRRAYTTGGLSPLSRS